MWSAPVSPLGQRFYVKTKDAAWIASPTTLGVDPVRIRNPLNEEQPIHPLYGYLYVADREEGLILIGAATLLDGDPRNNFLKRALTYNPDNILHGANHVVSEADLVIYCGSTTSDHTTGGWKLPKQGTAIIQIDIDPLEIGRNYPGTVGILADVRAALEALRAAAPATKREAWLAQSKAHFDTWRSAADKNRNSDQVPLRPERICRELTEVLPEDAILFADTGYAALLTGTLMHLKHPAQRFFQRCLIRRKANAEAVLAAKA